jgi:hypothetical protein
MSIQEIAASTKSWIDDLEERVPNFWSNLGVNEVSAILRIVSFTFLSMDKLAREGHPNEAQLISEDQLQKIIELMDDLSDNFFPMAHTQEPYQNLRIVSFRKFQLILERHAHDVGMLQELLQQIDHLKGTVVRKIEDIEDNAERLHEVFNP